MVGQMFGIRTAQIQDSPQHGVSKSCIPVPVKQTYLPIILQPVLSRLWDGKADEGGEMTSTVFGATALLNEPSTSSCYIRHPDASKPRPRLLL